MEQFGSGEGSAPCVDDDERGAFPGNENLIGVKNCRRAEQKKEKK